MHISICIGLHRKFNAVHLDSVGVFYELHESNLLVIRVRALQRAHASLPDPRWEISSNGKMWGFFSGWVSESIILPACNSHVTTMFIGYRRQYGGMVWELNRLVTFMQRYQYHPSDGCCFTIFGYPQFIITLDGTNISHLVKGKSSSKVPLGGDMLVSRRVYNDLFRRK